MSQVTQPLPRPLATKDKTPTPQPVQQPLGRLEDAEIDARFHRVKNHTFITVKVGSVRYSRRVQGHYYPDQARKLWEKDRANFILMS